MQPIERSIPQAMGESNTDAVKNKLLRRKGVSFKDLSLNRKSCSKQIQGNAEGSSKDIATVAKQSLDQRAVFDQARQSLDEAWDEINTELLTDTFFPIQCGTPGSSQSMPLSHLLATSTPKEERLHETAPKGLSVAPQASKKGTEVPMQRFCNSPQTAPDNLLRRVAIVPSINKVASASKFSTPDGSIEPVSGLYLTNLGDLAFTGAKRILEGISNSIPGMQKIHQYVRSEHALVLTANTDYNGVFDLTLKQPYSVIVFKKLEKSYDVTYKRISDVETLCKAIDEETAQRGPIDLLVLRAHGTIQGVRLDTFTRFEVGDHLPSKSCLQNLPQNATIILDSCATGKGQEHWRNFANYIAEHSPPGTRIFAPTSDTTTGFTFSKGKQIEVRFFDLHTGLKEDNTYKIDPNNKEHATCGGSKITNIPDSVSGMQFPKE